MSNKSTKNSTLIGKDAKGRKLYKGSKGGVFYVTKSGYKKYVTESNLASPAKSAGKDEQGRKLYEGSKGGVYYVTESGYKKYVTESYHISMSPAKSGGAYRAEKRKKTAEKKTNKIGKETKLYEGPRGGVYYLDEDDEKHYVALDVVGTDKNDRSRRLYEDEKGIFYLTKGGERRYKKDYKAAARNAKRTNAPRAVKYELMIHSRGTSECNHGKEVGKGAKADRCCCCWSDGGKIVRCKNSASLQAHMHKANKRSTFAYVWACASCNAQHGKAMYVSSRHCREFDCECDYRRKQKKGIEHYVPK